MSTPLISVIVPVYQVEPYLHECVDSILGQSFHDFELILVDDGSPDNCGVICDEYAAADSRVRVIHQKNGGLSAARNAGIEAAKGGYLTFIDSDDMVFPLFLEHLMTIVKTNDAEIACCNMVEFPEDGKPHEYQERERKELLLSGHDAALDQYGERSLFRVSSCSKLYLATLFSNIRFPIGMLHEDQAITPIVLYKAKRVVASDLMLYCYRLRTQSIMHSKFSAKRYDDIAAVEHCIEFFEEKKEKDIVIAARKRRDELLSIYALIARKEGVYSTVPKQYRISEHKALKWLRENLSDDKYTYQLAKVHPKWLRPHAYIRKLKKMLNIPCN